MHDHARRARRRRRLIRYSPGRPTPSPPLPEVHDAGDAPGRWRIGRTLPCLHCGYDLRGLTGPIVPCPECGKPNDLRDPRPWRARARQISSNRSAALPMIASVASLLGVGVGLMAVTHDFHDFNVALTIIVFGPAIWTMAWGLLCYHWIMAWPGSGRAWAVAVLMGCHAGAWGLVLGGLVLLLTGLVHPALIVGAVVACTVAVAWLLHRATCRADLRHPIRSFTDDRP